MRAKAGHKLIKVKVLTDDGDLVWDIIEVEKTDKRKEFNPASDRMANPKDVQSGNPMADKNLGKNDVEVSGVFAE